MLNLKVGAHVGSVPSYATVYAATTTTVTYTSTPGELFPGMTSDGTDITIPIASMTAYGLLAAHCVPTTGDARQLSSCLVSRMKDWYTLLEEDAKPLAMTASVRRMVGFSSGDFPYKPKDEYRMTFYIDWPDEVVVEEPT